MQWIAELPWTLVLVACLSLGLAPFAPQPHVVEKLQMLSQGTLVKPMDIFDLFMHGAPWLVLIAKVVVTMVGGGATGGESA